MPSAVHAVLAVHSIHSVDAVHAIPKWVSNLKSLGAAGGLVYSTEGGRMCPSCRQPLAQCVCGKASGVAPGDGIVRVSRESKGRGGKEVTVVKGVALETAALLKLAQQLKAACGS